MTEACILTKKEYHHNYSRLELINIAKDLSNLGPLNVVITGIVEGDNILNLAYNKSSDEAYFTSVKYNNRSYSGTGDIFTSIICGLLTNNYDLNFAVETATKFIYKTINYTSQFNTDRNDGVMFEMFLGDLISL